MNKSTSGWTQHFLASASVVVVCFAAAPAHAQLFSPGPLSNAHKNLEGETNCLRCHAAGMKTPQVTCLKCHQDVRGSIEQRKGLHGHLPQDKLQCETCHQEHLGRNNNLMPWRANRADFDHRLTGWPLDGAHSRVRCESCHTKKKDNGTPAYMGLSPQCSSCHFDEHRGQEDKFCERCHTTRAFSPAPLFEHSRTDFALTGKHRRVKCSGCHPQVRDTATPASAKPAPVSMVFEKFKNIDHNGCIDCHRDPHNGKFGKVCASCHTTDAWSIIAGTKVKDITFHDKARFHLEGAHTTVMCKSCHGPFGSIPAKFTGLKFDACEDCHIDAHEGQFAPSEGHTAPPCAKCHTVQSFVPATFDAQEHAKTRYPLKGAHEAVPCASCHREDPAILERVSVDNKALLRLEGRPLLTSEMVFKVKKPLDRCDSCHQSPHGAQFDNRVQDAGCTDCHKVSSFHDVKFDHNKESRFQLTGAHAKTDCGSCHTVQEIPSSGGLVGALYKPLSIQCNTCHDDVHAGQLRNLKTGVTACETCHNTTAFKPAPDFDHNDPNTTTFPLEGRHAVVDCDKCHLEVQITSRTTVRRYKPLPNDCVSCHADYHKGALKNVPEWAGSDTTPCSHCHSPESWTPASYREHAQTGFPLEGLHASTPCVGCHTREFKTPISPRCDNCHRDAHAGELGMYCSTCHTTLNWQSNFDAAAHRTTSFPLRGAHAAVPCQECHIGAFSNNFRGTAASCDGCHDSDYLRAGLVSINHVASGFSTNCRNCHDPWAFQRGRLADHEACFPIATGMHTLITCAGCHTTLAGTVDNGQCQTGTFDCTGCHTHNLAATNAIHIPNVPNYVYINANCYACHRQGI